MMGSAIQAGREEGIAIGCEQGIEIGREEGIGIGREEGIGIGREEGRRAGKAESLVRNLTNKFGPLAAEHRNRVEGADEATVDRWSDAMFYAASIDDLFRV